MGAGAFLKKAAPWLGAMAGMAIPGAAPFIALGAKLLTDGTGKTVPATQQGLSDAITQAMETPDQLAKLREIDNQFAEQMKLMGIESAEHFEQMAVDDRASARNREEQVKDWMPKALGCVLVGSFVGAVFLLLTGHGKIESALGGTLIGYLAAKADLVATYYFGSSAGSDRKTELLAEAPAIAK